MKLLDYYTSGKNFNPLQVQVFPESEEDARDRGRCLIKLMYNNKNHAIEVRVPILTGLVIGKRKRNVNLQCQA